VIALSSFQAIADRIDALQNTPFPGTGLVSLEAGTRIVYYEPKGGTSSVGQPSQVAFQDAVEVIGADGQSLAESPQSTSIQLSVGSFDGYAMFQIEVPADGDYRVVADGGTGIVPGEVAIGEKIFGDTARTLIFGILGAVVAVLSFAFVIAAFFSRRVARRRGDRGQLSSPGMEGLPPPPSEF